jgi:hypothetical protein
LRPLRRRLQDQVAECPDPEDRAGPTRAPGELGATIPEELHHVLAVLLAKSGWKETKERPV